MRPLKQALASPLAHMVRKLGFMNQEILLNWSEIVGRTLADHVWPEKITFPPTRKNGGRLYLKTTSGFAPMVQFQQLTVLERVNQFFGYKAVDKLIIRHTLEPTLSTLSVLATRARSTDSPGEAAHLFARQYTNDLEAGGMKDALHTLGTWIYFDTEKRRRNS